MSLSFTFISVFSGVCLLLWGLRTIKRAVLRGYGAQVQTAIASGTKNRFTSFFSGVVVAMVLQSSTAATILASSFVGRGLMTVSMGLAIVIGADLGTAIVAKLLSFDLRWLAPLLLSVGIIYHLMYDDGGHKRFAARIIMGLGFIMTSLAIIRDATAPLSESETLPLILKPLQDEPIIAIMFAAILTYIMHSGLSAVLLFSTLAAGNVLSLELALVFVVGANVGIGIIPMVAVMKDTPEAVQIPLGNIIMRMVTGFIILFTLPAILDFIKTLPYPEAQMVVIGHVAFNILLAILFLPLVTPLAKLCAKISPAKDRDGGDNAKPRYLDPKALPTPPAALSCATRETLRMAEVLESMLKESFDAIAKNDESIILSIRKKDLDLDTIFTETKDYIIRLTREELSDNEIAQSMRIMNFAVNLEHAGDVISDSLMDMAESKIEKQQQFSEEGLKEIKLIHEKVLKNAQLAQNIFLSSDPALAQQLLSTKKGLKIAEDESALNHMKRLQKGLPQTVSTSGIHMDVIRDLRRINTYITSVAYGVLDSK